MWPACEECELLPFSFLYVESSAGDRLSNGHCILCILSFGISIVICSCKEPQMTSEISRSNGNLLLERTRIVCSLHVQTAFSHPMGTGSMTKSHCVSSVYGPEHPPRTLGVMERLKRVLRIAQAKLVCRTEPVVVGLSSKCVSNNETPPNFFFSSLVQPYAMSSFIVLDSSRLEAAGIDCHSALLQYLHMDGTPDIQCFVPSLSHPTSHVGALVRRSNQLLCGVST